PSDAGFRGGNDPRVRQPQGRSDPMSGRPLVSILIPARNEEANIPALERELTQALDQLPDYDFEFLVIDNRSTDGTGERVKEICRRDPRWRYARLSRDFTVE